MERMLSWEKMGKIFDPQDHNLANNCNLFAQSPQSLIFDDFIRIYFSTREVDEKSNKFLSHISYVDFSKDFKRILKVSENTVIPLGELGTFDEHGIFPINILRDKNRILGYTCGWSRRVSVSVETSVGIAISEDDGNSFKKIGTGPILTSSLNEPFLVGDAFVCIFNNTYHMWYIYGKKWVDNEVEETARVYKIGYANSSDGLNWKKNEAKQIIPDILNENECQALPTVVYFNGKFNMFFCFREAIGFRTDKSKGYKLGYAYSDDMINWTRADEKLGLNFYEGEWDSDMQCYPNAFVSENKLHLLYNGNQFGKFGFGLAILKEFWS